MLRLLSRPRARRSSPGTRLVPWLEVLDRRDCPSAPQVSSLSATLLGGQMVQLTGYVADEDPTGAAVSFTGGMSGSVTPDTAGYFSFVGEAASLGLVYAQALDTEELTSDYASVLIQNSAPSVTLSYAHGSQQSVTFYGRVTDEVPAGLTVNFTNGFTGSTVVGTDGTFSLQTNLTALGSIQATVTDGWGVQSSSVSVTVTSPPPSFSNLQAVEGANHTWTVQGHVNDEDPNGLTVMLSGAIAGSVVADANGDFTYQTTSAALGQLQLSTTDWWGLTASTATLSLASNTPNMTMWSNPGPNHSCTLVGQVVDEFAAGMTISFTGAVSGRTTVAADGSFSFQTNQASLGAVQATTQDSWGQGDTAETQITNSAPSLTLNVAYGTGRTVILSGQVTDEYADGLTVTFANAYTGTTTVNADGSFSVQTDTASLGTVSASITDWWNATSSTAQASITNDVPTLSYAVFYGANHMIIITGQVTDDNPEGLAVTFSGVVSGTAITNADGTFGIQLQASSLGAISAVVTDFWNQSPDAVQYTLTNSAPAIVSFTVSAQPDNYWRLSGQVTDEHAAGLTITLDGDVAQLVGLTATVTTDGTFCFDVWLPTTARGIVTAKTTDWWDLTSSLATAVVL